MKQTVPVGAYGLVLRGFEPEDLLAQLPLDCSWPQVEVQSVGGTRQRVEGEVDRVDQHRASLSMLDGDHAFLDRERSRATYVAAEERSDGRALHPFLTVVGTVFAWWLGHEAFHGGGFLAGGGAWGVLGDREAGKSSMLAAVSLSGRVVLTDDLLVVAGATAFVGPRCIDLRPNVASALRLEGSTCVVRGGERRRLPQTPAPAGAPMRGWIFPIWGERLELAPLTPRERMALLHAHRCVPGTPGSEFIQLIDLPAWRLVRPRRWDLLERTVEWLLDVCET